MKTPFWGEGGFSLFLPHVFNCSLMMTIMMTIMMTMMMTMMLTLMLTLMFFDCFLTFFSGILNR